MRKTIVKPEVKRIDPELCSAKELAEYFIQSVTAFRKHRCGGAELINTQVFAINLFKRLEKSADWSEKVKNVDPFSNAMFDLAEEFLAAQ